MVKYEYKPSCTPSALIWWGVVGGLWSCEKPVAALLAAQAPSEPTLHPLIHVNKPVVSLIVRLIEV